MWRVVRGGFRIGTGRIILSSVGLEAGRRSRNWFSSSIGIMAADLEWSGERVRNTFIEFFKEHQHSVVHSSSVIPHNDPTLLFANAGMNQFKDIFLCTVDPNSDFAKLKRAVNSQKCIRAGGKHNDLDDVGRDNYHHTFFEMLGNWSFADFFKTEAIEWAWTLLTKVYKLNPDRLYATYFEGDESRGLAPDLEALELWKRYLPENRILKGNYKDNFWEMGDVGPCGPCSEIHYDRIGDRDAAHLVNMDDPTVLEIWNLVFMQYERKGPDHLVSLPGNHVDTGMGLERLCSILQGKMSNYDIDLFQDIFKGIEKECETSPYLGKMGDEDTDQHDMAFRVIADHIRMLSIAIADGQKPGPAGRAYVMRRVLRRAVRFGDEKLNAPTGFFHKLVPYVVQTLGGAFPSLKKEQVTIARVLQQEERLFTQALRNGQRKFNAMVKRTHDLGIAEFAPEDAAQLYTVFGFPVDLTRIKAEEHGFKYNEEAVEELLLKEKKISEEAHKRKKAERMANAVKLDPSAIAHLADVINAPATNDNFKYNLEDITAKVVAIFSNESFVESSSQTDKESNFGIVLDGTNFYAEAGGQEHDVGSMRLAEGKGNFLVENVQSFGSYVLHSGHIEEGEICVGDTVELSVDLGRRQPLMANHTCTHMLNFSLRSVLGDEVHQKGSLVQPMRFRFDFQHGQGLSAGEMMKVESVIRTQIEAGLLVDVELVDLDKAREIFGVRAMFDEHYPNPVRVVSIGQKVTDLLRNPKNQDWYNYSVEFCGGTHLSSAEEVGNFVILSEEAIAAGIRRIVATTGQEAVDALENEAILVQDLEHVKSQSLGTNELDNAIRALEERLNNTLLPAVAKLRCREELKKMKQDVMANLKKSSAAAAGTVKSFLDDLLAKAKEQPPAYIVENVPNSGGQGKVLREFVVGFQKEFPDIPIFFLSVDQTHKNVKKHKLTIVAFSSDAAVAKGVNAKDWAAAAAAVAGGKGGGKAVTAQGSGPKLDAVEEVLKVARDFVESKVSH
mmetsp:Transcript_33509/g.94250  ORF Transcript_33509/g.94250 Transcript_33509/m.94250 type:complete len:1009 (+) Transcript_33509:45-3071(+)